MAWKSSRNITRPKISLLKSLKVCSIKKGKENSNAKSPLPPHNPAWVVRTRNQNRHPPLIIPDGIQIWLDLIQRKIQGSFTGKTIRFTRREREWIEGKRYATRARKYNMCKRTRRVIFRMQNRASPVIPIEIARNAPPATRVHVWMPGTRIRLRTSYLTPPDDNATPRGSLLASWAVRFVYTPLPPPSFSPPLRKRGPGCEKRTGIGSLPISKRPRIVDVHPLRATLKGAWPFLFLSAFFRCSFFFEREREWEWNSQIVELDWNY